MTRARAKHFVLLVLPYNIGSTQLPQSLLLR